MSDPYISNVVLLLHGNQTNGDTTFYDSGNNFKSVTGIQGAQVSTTRSKWGSGSLYFDGVDAVAATTTSPDWDFPGDFTIEWWSWKSAYGGATDGVLRCAASSSPVDGWQILLDAARFGFYYHNSFTGSETCLAGALTNIDSAWHHYAVCRASGTIRLFHDGVVVATLASTTNFITGGQDLLIGALSAAGVYSFNGYIDDLRITKNVARYTADFSASLPSAEFDSAPQPTMQAYLTPLAITETMNGGGFFAIAPPSSTIAVYGGGLFSLQPQAATTSMYSGGVMAAVAANPTITFLMHDATDENSAHLQPELPTVSFVCGSSMALTARHATLEFDGTSTELLTFALTPPYPSVALEGTTGALMTVATGPAAATLEAHFGSVIVVEAELAALTMTSTTGGVLGFTLTPLASSVSMTMTRQASMGFDLVPEMAKLLQGMIVSVGPRLPELLFTGHSVVVATYEAYAVNLKHNSDTAIDEVTRYTNFPFTHIVRFENNYFAVASDGLYMLGGETDYAVTPTGVPWAFKTATTDFGSPEMKNVESAYFGGRLGPSATLTLYAGEGEQTQAYNYTTPRGELAQNYRQKFGKGIRDHRYYAVGANGAGEFALDTADFKVFKRTRRI